jgi:hypothetical protein
MSAAREQESRNSSGKGRPRADGQLAIRAKGASGA